MKQCRVGNRMTSLEVENSWVVPFSAILIRIFNCHINVKLCISRVGSVKYLFKYMCKGRDRVTVELAPENPADPNQTLNEINNYVDARYVSASEAI